MFEKLFNEPSTVDRYRAAPLAEHRLRYLQHLAESGVKRGMLRRMARDQLRAVRLLDLQEGDTVSISRIQATAKDRDGLRSQKRVGTPPEPPKPTEEFWRRIARWLRFLGWLEQVPVEVHQHVAEVGAFVAWMRDQRGLSAETVRVYRRMVNEFLRLAGEVQNSFDFDHDHRRRPVYHCQECSRTLQTENDKPLCGQSSSILPVRSQPRMVHARNRPGDKASTGTSGRADTERTEPC